jgi:RNA polymerase sigma factor (sigma-70 family)
MSVLNHPQRPQRSQREEVQLEQFLHQIRPRLKALFARYKIPPQDTEDILQQALLALIYQWEDIRDPEAWLLGTLKNRCLLYFRDRRRQLYDVVDATVLEWMAEPRPPEQEQADLARDLGTVIGRLPERCQSLLLLRYRLGYESSEVAERLGYSPTSMSKVTTRCLATLMRHLTAAGFGRKKHQRS